MSNFGLDVEDHSLEVLETIEGLLKVNTAERVLQDISRMREMIQTGYINAHEACEFISEYGCNEPYFDMRYDKHVSLMYNDMQTVCKANRKLFAVIHAMCRARRSAQVFRVLHTYYLTFDADFADYKSIAENIDWSDDWLCDLFNGQRLDRSYCRSLNYDLLKYVTPKHYPGIYTGAAAAIADVNKPGIDLSWLSDTRWRRSTVYSLIELIARYPEVDWLKYIKPTMTTFAAVEIMWYLHPSVTKVTSEHLKHVDEIIDYWKYVGPKVEYAITCLHRVKDGSCDVTSGYARERYDEYREKIGLEGTALAKVISRDAYLIGYPSSVEKMQREFDEVCKIPNDPVAWCRSTYSDTASMSDEDVWDAHQIDWRNKHR